MLNNDLQTAIELSIKTYNDEKKRDNDEKKRNKIITKSDIIQFEKQINLKNSCPNHKLFALIYHKLNKFQKKILVECIEKKSAGLSLPLGSGKTLIALLLGLYFIRNTNVPFLVIVPKSLIANWEQEIIKFFDDLLNYEIVHQSVIEKNINNWKIQSSTQLVLTTIDTLTKYYKEYEIEQLFVNRINNKGEIINTYNDPNKPFINFKIGGGYFYSIQWGCFIVDEIQKYVNIETRRCRALGAVCSKYRWLLSGTIFDEPNIKNILGYYVILNVKDRPEDITQTHNLIHDPSFKGLNDTLILRHTNEEFIMPQINEHVITHKLSIEEETVYLAIKKILNEIQKKATQAKIYNDIEEIRKINSYKLVIIMYLRQSLVCPLIPLSSIAINACDITKKKELSTLILNEINKLKIKSWLDDEKSVKSSRMKACIKCINKHQDEKIIIFSCFSSYLDVFQYFITNLERPIFRMKSSMTAKMRGQLINKFKKSKNGILLLTYQLGAEGLNLQFVSTIFLTDFWWNASKVQQAIGRVCRYGQQSDTIDIYFFTSNTGIEKVLFEKQISKIDILEELRVGPQKKKIVPIKLDTIIKMIEVADNKKLLKSIKYY